MVTSRRLGSWGPRVDPLIRRWYLGFGRVTVWDFLESWSAHGVGDGLQGRYQMLAAGEALHWSGLLFVDVIYLVPLKTLGCPDWLGLSFVFDELLHQDAKEYNQDHNGQDEPGGLEGSAVQVNGGVALVGDHEGLVVVVVRGVSHGLGLGGGKKGHLGWGWEIVRKLVLFEMWWQSSSKMWWQCFSVYECRGVRGK